MVARGRKPARFHRAGGSKSVIVPKEFLDTHQINEQNAEWVLTDAKRSFSCISTIGLLFVRLALARTFTLSSEDW